MVGDVKLAATVLGTLLLLAACSGGGEDGAQIPQNQRNLIDQAATDGDCRTLQGFFNQTQDADTLDYIDQQMRDAGCY
jgi:hypothetical protein